MSLKINIDAAALAKEFADFALEVQFEMQRSMANLAAITHAKVKEMASTELKSSRQEFIDAVSFEEIADGVWVVSIDEKALWIEEGIKPNFDMKPGLLKNAKVSKDGSRYKVIPFEHSKAPSQMTPSAQTIVTQLRKGLKEQKIPFKTIEKNADGSPRTGKLHTINLASQIPGKGNTPALSGVNIYQSIAKNGNVRRDILTYRTVTDGPSSRGKWIHPGMDGKKFLDKAAEWAMGEWSNKILPEIMERWKK